MPGLLYEPFDSSTTIISDISSNEHSDRIKGRSTIDIIGSIIGFIVFFALMYFVYRWFIKPHIKKYRRKVLDKQPRSQQSHLPQPSLPRSRLPRSHLPQPHLQQPHLQKLLKQTTGRNLFGDESDPHTAEIFGQDTVQDPFAITNPTKKTISTFSPHSISSTSKMQPQPLTDFCKSKLKIEKLKGHLIQEHGILSKLKTELNSLKTIVPRKKFHVKPILDDLEKLSTESHKNQTEIDKFLDLYKHCK